MTPSIRHIVRSGAKTEINFLALQNAQKYVNQQPDFRQSFIAFGSFGRVNYDQYDLSTCQMINFTLSLEEEIEIDFNVDSEDISIIYCNQGVFKLQRNDFPDVLVAQTQVKAIYSHPGEKYSIFIKPAETRNCNLFHFNIKASEFSTGKPTMAGEIGKYFQKISDSENNNLFTATIDFRKGILSIRNELGKENPDLHLIKAYIDILLLELVRHYELQRLGGNGLNHWDPEIRAVYTMAEMIILEMDESWTIKKFAGIQHLNPNKLKILFKKHMGMHAAAFRISVRMQKASQLLRETKLSIQEISALVGYTNPAQFSTMFKRKIGCTPNQIRKE